MQPPQEIECFPCVFLYISPHLINKRKAYITALAVFLMVYSFELFGQENLRNFVIATIAMSAPWFVFIIADIVRCYYRLKNNIPWEPTRLSTCLCVILPIKSIIMATFASCLIVLGVTSYESHLIVAIFAITIGGLTCGYLIYRFTRFMVELCIIAKDMKLGPFKDSQGPVELV